MTEGTVHAKLKWLIGLRVVVVTVFLGLSLALETTPSRPAGYSVFSYLIVGTYALTIIYALALRWVGSQWAFAVVQIAGDLASITVVTATTGGVESPFIFLYPIVIIAGTMVLGRTGGLATLAATAAIYAVLGWSHLTLGEWGTWWEHRQVFSPVVLNVLAFLAVFLLSSHLVSAAATATKRLAERESGFRALSAFHENVVQSMSSGLLTADLDGRVTSFNQAGEAILGLARGAALGRTWWDVLGWPDGQEFAAGLARRKMPHRFERDFVSRNGESRIIGMTLSWLKSADGEAAGLIGVFQDLTEIKALEENMRHRERLASVGELAAGLAHEIRNPLAAVSGAMQVLQHDLPLDEEQQTLMAIALRESERLNALIGQFLLYARPASGQKNDCDVVPLVGETLALLKTHHDYHDDVVIESQCSDEALWVRANANQLRQVVWNLVLNALQAMADGGTLRVELRAVPGHDGQHRWVEMAVRDTGRGIEPQDLSRIFVPFFTTKNGGSGLGLAIVHRIIEEHGGRVDVRSEVNKGTMVTVTLPAGGDQPEARDDRQDTAPHGIRPLLTPSVGDRSTWRSRV